MKLEALLAQLRIQFPSLQFEPGKQFCWSPEQTTIFYRQAATGDTAIWSLLHETGHALLGHQTYQADFELLQIEIAAWERAGLLASNFGITIDDNHIQDCLDTYRDWLYQRSICPNCSTKCMQEADFSHYRCFNCHKVWRVSANRFARAYRSTKNVTQKLPLGTIFHLEN
jgi:hypothetical protein